MCDTYPFQKFALTKTVVYGACGIIYRLVVEKRGVIPRLNYRSRIPHIPTEPSTHGVEVRYRRTNHFLLIGVLVELAKPLIWTQHPASDIVPEASVRFVFEVRIVDGELSMVDEVKETWALKVPKI